MHRESEVPERVEKLKKQKNMTKVFISHSTEDKDFVQKLAIELERNNISVFVADTLFHNVGLDWAEGISKAV